MNKQSFWSAQITIPAGRTHKLSVAGKYVIVLENNLAANPFIGIGGGSFYELPGGVGVPYPDGFTVLFFKNPDLVNPMTLFVAISDGQVNDHRLIFASTLPVEIVIPATVPVSVAAAVAVTVAAMLEVRDVSTAIETPAAIVALPIVGDLINNAAAVNVGGGVVGIPVTGQPFATGEDVTIANTVNYNATYTVLASSGANQVDITETFAAETFDGVDDSIVLVTPRSIATNSDRKELEIHNHDAALALFFGDTNLDPDNNRGILIAAGDGEIITNQAQIFFAAPTAAGLTGVTFSYAEHTKA